MTPEQQREAITEVCGFYADFTSDLNAMHEAEKVLNDEQQWDWVTQIHRTLPKEPHFKALVFRIGTATAAQRAEAFLRTLGIWQDDAGTKDNS